METLIVSSIPVKSPVVRDLFGTPDAELTYQLSLSQPLPKKITQAIELVPCPISQRKLKDTTGSFEVYPRSLRVIRPPAPCTSAYIPPDRTGLELQGFSKKSKSRLRFLAVNSVDHISSQYCMTYGDDWPDDGALLKKHLNLFLTNLRLKFPDLHYIWVAEFQSRGSPHFHFFSDLAVNPDNHKILTDAWHRIVGGTSEKHAKVHNHAKNFIPWDMGNGSYLCKYLDKEHQKQIPDGFSSFGRWWGNSRNIKAIPETVSCSELDIFLSDSFQPSTGEMLTDSVPQYLIRTMVKYQLRVNPSKWSVKRSQTMTVLTGATVFKQALEYLEKQSFRRFKS